MRNSQVRDKFSQTSECTAERMHMLRFANLRPNAATIPVSSRFGLDLAIPISAH